MTKLNPLIEAMSNIDDALVQKAQKAAKAPIRIRTLCVAAAAALALGATAAGAVAVYNHNVTEQYANILENNNAGYAQQEYKTADNENVDKNATALNGGLYDDLNIEINRSFEYEDFTFEFPGALYDGKDILIMYNIVFNKDLPCLHLPMQDFNLWIDTEAYQGPRCLNGIMSERDGKTVYHGYVDYNNVDELGDVMNLRLYEMKNAAGRVGVDNYEAELDIDLAIPLTGDFSNLGKTVEPSAAQHIDLGSWGEWDFEGVELRPLSIRFNLSGNTFTEDYDFIKYRPVFPISVTMKDGSVLELKSDMMLCCYYDEETDTTIPAATLNVPIDVDNVQSVQFASVVIDVDGNAATVEIPEIYDRFDEDGHWVER